MRGRLEQRLNELADYAGSSRSRARDIAEREAVCNFADGMDRVISAVRSILAEEERGASPKSPQQFMELTQQMAGEAIDLSRMSVFLLAVQVGRMDQIGGGCLTDSEREWLGSIRAKVLPGVKR